MMELLDWAAFIVLAAYAFYWLTKPCGRKKTVRQIINEMTVRRIAGDLYDLRTAYGKLSREDKLGEKGQRMLTQIRELRSILKRYDTKKT